MINKSRWHPIPQVVIRPSDVAGPTAPAAKSVVMTSLLLRGDEAHEHIIDGRLDRNH
jgi:hypothetical protein